MAINEMYLIIIYCRSWHPQSVYRVDFEKWTHLNLSEWDVHSPFQPRCSQNESAEILSDLGKFVLISDGGLFMSHKLLHLFPQEFCFDQQIGNCPFNSTVYLTLKNSTNVKCGMYNGPLYSN